MSARSELFQPYRAIGFICDSVPFHFKKLGTENFITVSIGNAWQVYNCDKLRLSLIGPQRETSIRAVASAKHLTFTAHGPEILVWKRMDEVCRLKGHVRDVKRMLVLGSFLLSVCEDGVVVVWDLGVLATTKQGDAVRPHSRIEVANLSPITCFMHPHTYLNKIVIGFEDGTMELWNIKTSKKIYSFNTAKWKLVGKGQDSPRVNCIVQSPAVDVVGVGLESGDIVLLNLKVDKTIATFKQTQGSVVALDFRTDGFPRMATSSRLGHIVIWDLDKKKLEHIMENAHDSTIPSLKYLPGEPLLVSSGADNALKMWIYDQPDGSGRLFKSRVGHSAPPSRVRFYDDGKTLLSAGLDRSLRIFNVAREQQNTELSQGSILKKSRTLNVKMDTLRMPRVVDFAATPAKDRQWCNILTCHEDESVAHTWSYEAKVLGTKNLRREEVKPSPVLCVALSACGNFGLLGMEDGRVEKFNMQSGFFRQTFGKKNQGHKGSVLGVACDGLNRYVVSAGLDAKIKFWNFRKATLEQTIEMSTPINQMILNRENDLLAVCTDDLQVSVFDATTRKMVRCFKNSHPNRVSDMCFSPDGRWLVTSCMDSSLRVFDLPSGRLVDWLAFDTPVTSLSFSPKSDFLATTHAGTLGIYLWVNRSYFTNVYYHTSMESPVDMTLPKPASTTAPRSEWTEDTDNRETRGVAPEEEETEDVKHPHLISLSGVPSSKWQNLAMLDIIKERNKPTEAPKKPASMPFFLPTVVSLETKLDDTKLAGIMAVPQSDETSKSRIIKSKGMLDASPLVLMLKDAFEKRETEESGKRKRKGGEELDETQMRREKILAITTFVKGMSPSAIDAEIRALGADIFTEMLELAMVIDFVTEALDEHCDFEFLQAFLNLFLKVHSDTITTYPELIEKLKVLSGLQRKLWTRLEKSFHHNLCLVAHFSKTQL